MAVKLRLARHGSKGHPFYRIVATSGRSPRDGRFLELVGTYDPSFKPPAVKLQRDRIQHWLSVGATPSETVASLLRRYYKAEDVVAPTRSAYVPRDLPPEASVEEPEEAAPAPRAPDEAPAAEA